MRSFLISSLMIFLFFNAHASVLQLENGTLEKTLAWGGYAVKIMHYQNPQLADVAQIRSSSGRVLREVRGIGIYASSESQALLEDFTGDGIPELRLMAWSGGAYCCYTDIVFSRARGLENILIFAGNEYHLTKGVNSLNKPPRDLNRDGRPELMLENDAISHLNGSTHGATSVLVLQWNGSRYIDATRKFPRVAQARAAEFKQAILTQSCATSWSLECLDLATGFYANSLLAGNERIARVWLMDHGAKDWVLTKSLTVKQALNTTKCRIGLSQQQLIYASTTQTRVPNSGC
jgi:hypothetical protein